MKQASDKTVSAVSILVRKAGELGKIPKKSDLSERELCFVKGVLGPFPRALEKAGLKPARKPKANDKRKKR